MTQKSSHPKQRKEPKNRPPAEAFEALEKLYRRVDKEISESGVECWLRGDCCDFEKVAHALFAFELFVFFVFSFGFGGSLLGDYGRCGDGRDGEITVGDGKSHVLRQFDGAGVECIPNVTAC